MDALRIYGGPEERGVPVLFYLCLPLDLAHDPRLSHAQIALAAILAGHCSGDSFTCWPGTARLMELSGLSRRGVQTGLVALEKAGWIARRVQTGKRPSRMIDLLWQRPKAHGPAPQPARGSASKAQPAAPGIRSGKADPRSLRVASTEEPEKKEPPSAEQVAYWRQVEASDRGVMGRMARIALDMIARDFPASLETTPG